MKMSSAVCFAILAQAFTQCASLPDAANAADVMPIWQNDTVANALSFNDTFGHQVSIGTYNPSTGAFSVPTGSISVGATFTGGLVSISGSPVTGPAGTLAFTVAGTSGGIPYFSGGTTWASSAALGANQIVLGGGPGVAPSTPLGLGTVTQLLHGNASGPPSYGPIVSADVATVLASPPCIGCTSANSGAFTGLTATGLTGLTGALNISGSSGGQPTLAATNTGGATLYSTPAFSFLESEGYASFGSTNTHFGLVEQATKNVAGSNTTGSRQAVTWQQLGVGGTATDFFTAGFELTEPCLAPITCNAFNLSGNFTGSNPYVYIPVGMTPTTIAGQEIDTTVLSSGATVRQGLRIVDIAGTQHGTIDAGINVVSSGVGFLSGLYWGDSTGTFSIAAGGTFFDTPATTVALNTFMNFANISGTPTLAGILFAANANQTIGWGTHTACCGGGSISSQTATNGPVQIFGNNFVAWQFAAVNSVFIQPNGSIQQIKQTIAVVLASACNSGSEGVGYWIHDTVGSAAATYHLIVAGGGGTTVDSHASCNGTNWVYD